ncbi:AbrB family transcriptional regulator [Mesorhizobium sp. SB112]|uniref:AbrB family transcriptional regulator n=1 Tax=Mesorhizobium sp. SB112 TaxID=3151853 RepID=UPI00326596B1
MSTFILRIRTFIIGTLGGVVGFLLGLPLGWLMGAMIATIPFAIAGMNMPSSWRLRQIMVGVIGVMVGGSFRPDVVENAMQWPFSLAAVGIYVLIMTIVGVFTCIYIGKMDRLTAAFSAAPGGLSELLILGPALGADVRTLSLVHGMRLVVILLTVPVIVATIGLASLGGTAVIDRSVNLGISMPLQDAAILLACLFIGMLMARKLRFPAANLTGPLLLSALAHFSGLTSFHPPQLIVIIAQITIGVSIAQFFVGITGRQMLSGLAIGGGLTAMSLSLAALFALAFEAYLDIPFSMGFIALVPGGLPEMSLISISLGIDPAFVSMHHLFRVVLLLTLCPILIPLWAGKAAPTPPP